MRRSGRLDRREFGRKTLFGGSAMILLGSRKVAGDSHGPRRTSSMDSDWKFHLGSVEGAETPSFDDTPWRVLQLPHDWSIEGDYSQGHGTDWQSGFLPAGIGWYRRHLEYEESWTGRQVRVLFDGVYLNSDVWINGRHLGHAPNGYVGFEYDLTGHLKRGDNVLAVRVDQSKPLTGRWYTGSGIYRHVWLIVTDPVHVETWGTFFTTPAITLQAAQFRIETTLVNETSKDQAVLLRSSLRRPDGRVSALVESDAHVPAGSRVTARQEGSLEAPLLWSPETPLLYTLRSEVGADGRARDVYETRVGVRKIEFHADRGFILNGRPAKLKGVCEHHTAGCVGAAIPEDLLRHRLQLLKAMGCNAIRTAHNPHAPAFYDLCDELGFLLMNEALDGWEIPKARDDYGNYFDAFWKQDMTRFIKRDRNHPSVIIWSIGNEVRKPSRELQKKLVDLFHALDPTRPVTQGGHDPTRGMKGAAFSTQLDIKGFNGDAEEKGVLEEYHQDHPDTPMVCTEVPHTYQTRGVYRTRTHWRRRDFPAPWEIQSGNAGKMGDLAERVFPIPDLTEEELFPEELAKTYFHGWREKPLEITAEWQKTLYYQSSYDNASVRSSARKAWQRARDFEFVMGQFRWTGFDYLGETNRWPSRFANFGVIDICGFPKDHYYLYQSMWSRRPMVHILPHWTHPGKEGKKVPVVAYTNCDSVELFMNGRSLGEQPYRDEQLVWLVPYEPGEIKAVSKKAKQAVAESVQRTAGAAAAVRLRVDRNRMPANGTAVARLEIDIVDADGVRVPPAGNMVEIELEGPARLIGIDNGDPLDLSPYKVPRRRAFRGQCLGVLQATDNPGEIFVTVKSPGLREAAVTLISG